MNSPQWSQVRLRGLYAFCNLPRQVLLVCGESIRCRQPNPQNRVAKLRAMFSLRLFAPALCALSFASCAQSQPSGPKVIQIPPSLVNATGVVSAPTKRVFPSRVKLYDGFEHKWENTGTERTRPRYVVKGRSGFFYKSGFNIDADGSPRAFHPVSRKGLDDLEYAGHKGNWWGILTNNGETSGRPIVQGKHDPAPGFYISPTALEDTTKRETDPRRFADAERVPYIVLTGTKAQYFNAKYGDYAVAYNSRNGKWAYAMCGDEWPQIKIGEGSIALAKRLGIPANPRDGGVDDGVWFLVFPGSRKTPWRAEESVAQTDANAAIAFQKWGGIAQLKALAK